MTFIITCRLPHGIKFAIFRQFKILNRFERSVVNTCTKNTWRENKGKYYHEEGLDICPK